MRRLAHISDLHFGRDDPAVAQALIADLNAFAPDLVIISGDLTQSARHVEFKAARAFIDALTAPVFCVPGNHDIPPHRMTERFFTPYRRWRRHISAETEPVWQDDKIVVVGLNTARRAQFHWNWSHGSINRRQVARIEKVFAAAPPGIVKIVVAHHPLVLPDEAFRMRRVRRARPALAAFSAMGVRLVLSGHFHISFVHEHPVDETRAAAADTPVKNQQEAVPLVAAHAATSISNRLRGEPNAYNRITIENGAIDIATSVWRDSLWNSNVSSYR